MFELHFGTMGKQLLLLGLYIYIYYIENLNRKAFNQLGSCPLQFVIAYTLLQPPSTPLPYCFSHSQQPLVYEKK